jgi:hypothetical protein
MNQDDIMRMARKAGFLLWSEGKKVDWSCEYDDELQRFAALAYSAGAAAEREKCAKKCESYIAAGIGKEMADAIRAMGNE